MDFSEVENPLFTQEAVEASIITTEQFVWVYVSSHDSSKHSSNKASLVWLFHVASPQFFPRRVLVSSSENGDIYCI